MSKRSTCPENRDRYSGDVKDRELVDAALVVAIKALQGKIERPDAGDDESIRRLAEACMAGLGNDLVVKHGLGNMPRFKSHHSPADILIDEETTVLVDHRMQDDTHEK